MTMVNDLTKIVGKKAVITEKKRLLSLKEDLSYVSGKAPAGIAKPKGMEAVQKIVRLANDKGIPLVPCSSTGPHARGDTVPLVENALIVDLSGMDAIIRIDPRNKVAMIEPGVTFQSLQEAVEEKGLRVAMPLAPRKGKSVISSMLEREPTLFPKYHWDMSDPLCCIEVIFGAGEMFRTGAAAGPGSLEAQWAAGQAQKSPMGPSQADWAKVIQGSQGSLGIVTWATAKLEQKPLQEKAFLVGSENLETLVDFTYAIVKPKWPDICMIINNTNLAALLDKEEVQKELPKWILLYSLSGYTHFPEERIDYLEKDIASIAAAGGISPKENLDGISAETLLSIANSVSKEPYWKARPAAAFQDIFFLTTMDKAPQFVRAMEAEVKKHGLPDHKLGAYLQPIHQGRSGHVEFTLMYHPENPEENNGIKALFLSAGKKMMDMGGFFSRPYGPWTDGAYAKCPDTVRALKKVKDILDPKGVMNPGKLCFK